MIHYVQNYVYGLNYLFVDDEDNNESEYTCQEQYLRSCEKYHVVPVSRFSRQLEGNSVILKNHQFSKGEFKACAVALMVSISVCK